MEIARSGGNDREGAQAPMPSARRTSSAEDTLHNPKVAEALQEILGNRNRYDRFLDGLKKLVAAGGSEAAKAGVGLILELAKTPDYKDDAPIEGARLGELDLLGRRQTVAYSLSNALLGLCGSKTSANYPKPEVPLDREEKRKVMQTLTFLARGREFHDDDITSGARFALQERFSLHPVGGAILGSVLRGISLLGSIGRKGPWILQDPDAGTVDALHRLNDLWWGERGDGASTRVRQHSTTTAAGMEELKHLFDREGLGGPLDTGLERNEGGTQLPHFRAEESQ